MKKIVVLLTLVALAVSAVPMVAAEQWIRYNGHGMSFEYPEAWGLTEGPTGVVVGDSGIFALSIVMHKEGCYPLSQHPMLIDFMLKMWGKEMDGTPDGDPITGYAENEIGPYSYGTQIYKNPRELLTCEIQGYPAKNVTITRAQAVFDPQNPKWGEIPKDLARLQKSLVITEEDHT